MSKESRASARVDQEVAIIGTGFAGLGMAIRLRMAGHTSFTIFERAGAVGGTWRENTYPGAACDIQSHLYSFSFEPNPGWSSMYASQQEILAYLEGCSRRHRLERHIRFHCGVVGAAFDDSVGVWTLDLSDGTTSRARTVIAGTGPLNRPNLPPIKGSETFAGTMFHSSRWDHECALEGKRVGVIGTGASAIQVVPQLARQAEHLTLLQRSAAWVVPKPDRRIGEREQRLYERFPLLQKLVRSRLYWNLEMRGVCFVVYPELMKPLQRLVERYLAHAVPDPELRAKVTPDYTLGCKRILMANDYYPALCRDNVEVITEGIDCITPDGVRMTDGREHRLDVIVWCTGFKAADDVAPFSVRGIGGIELADAWKSGAEAFLGASVAGFPNLFLLVGPNTGLGHNSMVFMIESQINYVMSCLSTMRRRKLRYMDVRRGVQTRFNQSLQSRMANTVWMSGCASWYQASNGKITTLWPGFTAEYRARTLRVNPRHYHCVRDGG